MEQLRLIEFPNAPTPDELRTPIGWGLPGSSTTALFDDENTVKICPVAIPIKEVGIFMYVCLLAFMLGGLLFPVFGFQPPDSIFWVMMIFGGLLVIPAMIGIFAWCNGQMGNSPYLTINKHQEIIELPRLGAKWPVNEVQSVQFVRCFVEGNQLFQVSLLIRSEIGKWTYAHVYNDGGDNHRNSWLFGSSLTEDQKLAKVLGVRWSYTRFRRDGSVAQEKTLDNQAVNGSRR